MPEQFPYTGVALDLDGVVWRGDSPIEGSSRAIGLLQRSGVPVVFVTNMSALTVADLEAKLARNRIDGRGAVVSSAMAAASLVGAGERVLVCGGPGVVEAVEAAGGVPVDGTVATESQAVGEVESVEAVMVGYHTTFDYWTLTRASRAVRAGARLIGTNHDPTFPTDYGLIPGGGALLAAVSAAAETAPTVAGKPHPPIAELVRARVGSEPLMVGDRADTDGEFATALGCDFGLVLSGVTSREDLPVRPEPQFVTDNLAGMVAACFEAVG